MNTGFRFSLLMPLLSLVIGNASPRQMLAQHEWAKDFPNVTLKTQDGADVRFYDDLVKDKTVIVNFIYTMCNEICERGTANLLQLQKSLGDRLGKDVFMYSITLKPDVDSPEVLKSYRDAHGVKPGWTFLTGSAEDIEQLRTKLGLSNLTPELRRTLGLIADPAANAADATQHMGMLAIIHEPTNKRAKASVVARPDRILQIIEGMNPSSSRSVRTAVASVRSARASGSGVIKTIEATADRTWRPAESTVAVGDTVEWKICAGRHGVRITNWADVKDHVEVETVVGQQPFNATIGQNDTSTNTAGQVLLRLKIKSAPTTTSEISFDCIVHGPMMEGKVTIPTIIPGTAKTIEGMGNLTWNPKDTTAAVGDTIEWKINAGFHGLRITNWADVKDHVEVETVVGQQSFDATTGQNVAGTGIAGQVLLRLKIKSAPTATSEITFDCIVHGPMMDGKVTIGTSPVAAKTIEGMGNLTWNPKDTTAAVGDTIEWKINAGFHGLRITNWADVKDHVEVETVVGQQSFDATTGQNVAGTGIAGQVLLRLKIKSAPTATSEITFDCIVHGPMMDGKVSIGTSPVAAKTIEGMGNLTWNPKDTTAAVGDTIEWKINAGFHGLHITNWADVKDHVEVETVVGQQPFDATTGQNDAPTGTAEQVLLRLKIKSVPAGTGEIQFNCIVHGTAMSGKVTVGSSASVVVKTIEGMDNITWNPKDSTAAVGDTLEWKINAGFHGVRITNWSDVKDHVEVQTVAGQQAFNATTGQNDAPTNATGQVLLRLKIKSAPAGTGEIQFNCIVHGTAMNGKVSVGASTPPVAVKTIEGMSNITWNPKGSTAAVGDTLEWKINAGFHGVRITNWSDVKDHVEVQTVAGQQAFNATTGQNDAPTNAAGQVLLRLKIKSAPAGTGEIQFNCIVHGTAMSGKVTVGSSAPVAVKTIEGMGNIAWNPKDSTATVGDTLEWKINAGFHGLRIMNWADVKDHVEVQTVAGQQAFNATTGQNDAPTSAAGQVLLRLKIKSVPAGAGEIQFNCIVHGPAMNGKVSVGASTPPVAVKTIEGMSNITWNPKDSTAAVGDTLEWKINAGLHGVRITNWSDVKDHVEVQTVAGQQAFNATTGQNDAPTSTGGQVLLRLKIKSVPAGAGEIQFNCIVHGPAMNGKVSVGASTPPVAVKTIEGMSNITWNPKDSTAAVGDTLEWKINAGLHGVRITNWSDVKDHVEVQTVAGQQAFNATTGQNDAPTSTAGQVLLRLKIKSVPAGAGEIQFNCIVHGPAMNGKVTIAILSVSTSGFSNSQLLAKLTPSMQRRMLHFVNRAYASADLMKPPQERRMQTEHMPPIAHKGQLSVENATYDRDTADLMLKQRPLDGYRDVRECLPLYNSPRGLSSLNSLLDSIGPRVFGQWEEVATDVPPVMHAALLHTGKVLLLTDSTDTVIWDPAGSVNVLPSAATGLTDVLFCSGHSFLSDGRLLVVGGGGGGAADALAHGWKFDPDSLKWSGTRNDMTFKRWYPSLVTLGQEPERVLVAAGLGTTGIPASRMEIYSEETDSFQLVRVTGPLRLRFPGTYPSLRVLPNGQIFHVATGWGVSADPCNQSPDGATVEPTALFTFSGPLTGSWRALGPNNRLKGMSVLLTDQNPPFVQSLVVGGGNASRSATAATMNLSTPTPAWNPAFTLLEARVHPNIVSLPDGTVFICGGKEASAPTPPDGGRCELFDPRPGAVALSEMDEMIRFRHYHSMAILLPDARVMAAGGARRGGCSVSVQNTIEVFSPPYLFRGPRPVISSATGFVEHGATIEIKTPSASGIRRVVLARPMAVTHQTDSEQRILPLSFTSTGPDSLEAVAPGGAGANPIAPRGYYMLFILDADGVPSVAKWIYLGATQVESLKANVQNDTNALKSDVDDSKLVDVNGTKRSLSEFDGRGHMLVLIRGAFCKHCASQLAEFQKRIDPAKIPVIVITPENDLTDLEDIPFTVLADPELSVFRKLNALGAEPRHGTFVFDADGKCLLKEIGEEPFADYDAIEKALSKVFPL